MKYGFTTALCLTNLSKSFTTPKYLFPRVAAPRNSLHRAYHTRSLQLPSGHQSLLPLVRSYNNLILPHNPGRSETPHVIASVSHMSEGEIIDQEIVVPFLISHDPFEKPVGYLRHQVVSAIEDDHQKHLVYGSASPWDLRYSNHPTKCLKSLAFADWVNEGGKFTRTMHMEKILLDWQSKKMFKEVLRSMDVSIHTYLILIIL